MSSYDKEYYEANKERIKERSRRNYQKKKEELRDKAVKRYHKLKSEMTPEELEARRAYARSRYHATKKPLKYAYKAAVKTPKDITVQKHPNGIYVIEFNIRKNAPYIESLRDDRTNYHLKRQLERDIIDVEKGKMMAVIEPSYIQVIVENENNLQLIVNKLQEFIKKNLENLP